MSALKGGAFGRCTARAVAAFLVLLAGGVPRARAQAPGGGYGTELRRAAAAWERQSGPQRQVVDQVCLVPDLPTFLQVIATWDAEHYFPILMDDVELTFKFLRAFQPSRIVRYPQKAPKIEPDKLWTEAVAAVGRSRRTPPDFGAKEAPRGDATPKGLGDTPPGVVFSSPDSPALAGAVALAAGRFQPLVALRTDKQHRDVLSTADARAFALDLEQRVADVVPRYNQLGDGCDFLTLAGDWPYRYQAKEGDNALDDLLGRFPDRETRWAFAGRLTGDLSASVYRAMCSLFLQPRSALLFNTYELPDKPWSDYRMVDAAKVLKAVVPVTHRAGKGASLSDWHEAFDPVNRFGLVLINTHGNPTQFNLPGGPGQSADVPVSAPAAVLMIHSFSASDPNDPDTIAGRWLAQGAFAYYGSMNEPYLQAFRVPAVVGALAAAGLPLSAAVRQSPPEPFGKPWRLMFLGDPLYRLDPREHPRLKSWAPVAEWPAYVEYEMPAADAPALVRMNWALKTAVFRFQSGARPSVRTDLAAVLLGIERGQLPDDYRRHYEALLADTLLAAKRPGPLLERFAAIPSAERSPLVKRLWETLIMERLQKLVVRRDFARAAELWSEAIGSPAPEDFHRQVTARTGGLIESRRDLEDWRQRLRKAARTTRNAATARIVADELKRVEEKLKAPSTAR